VVELALPDRTIAVETTDAMRFSPDSIQATRGETIAFVIHNGSAAPHEFVIGDEGVQQEHEAEMASGEADSEEAMEEMGDKPYAVDVPAGETRTLIYTFDEAGTLIFGCHVPGHYPAGMKGTIVVTES
jgi:uncharacterized cupredoxin-like copper-binding protein